MVRQINFDMDGTIADLYGVENWLEDLINGSARPYKVARPLVDMRKLAKLIDMAQVQGIEVNIISWLAKNSNDEYDKKVIQAKIKWLKKEMPHTHFDNIYILPYGTPKEEYGNGVLFDDEEKNRNNWKGIAFDVYNLLEDLQKLVIE